MNKVRTHIADIQTVLFGIAVVLLALCLNVTSLAAQEIADSSIVIEQPSIELPSATDSVVVVKKPAFAFTANLLYTAAGAFYGFHATPLAVGYEIPLGSRWSLFSNYLITLPWRAWNNNSDAFELMHWDLGFRWYTSKAMCSRRALNGFHLYFSAGMGYYDFQHNGPGYQGEEVLGALGLGYNITFGEHLSLNIEAGAGPIYSQYRYYTSKTSHEHLIYQYSGTFTYVGVTDAKITLTYLLYRKIKRKES